MLKTVQFMENGLNLRLSVSDELVEFVRRFQNDFDQQHGSRGYATTACILIPYNDKPILAFNDIPMCVEKEYGSTPRGVERAPVFAALGHAEVSAITFAARNRVSTNGATMVLAWFPCLNCADAIVKAGIKRVIATMPDESYKPTTYAFPQAIEHLRRAGVEVVFAK